MNDLKQLREMFRPLPGNHYMLVCTGVDEVAFLFQDMMREVGGKLNIVLYTQDETDDASKLQDASVERVTDLSKLFRAMPRDHDTVLFKDVFSVHKDQKAMLRLAYLTLANTANIMIMEKKGSMDVSIVKEMLDEHEFRAPNDIDIVEGYDLVSAKKMHMWGNGL